MTTARDARIVGVGSRELHCHGRRGAVPPCSPAERPPERTPEALARSATPNREISVALDSDKVGGGRRRILEGVWLVVRDVIETPQAC
jgi:hypothetical protein